MTPLFSDDLLYRAPPDAAPLHMRLSLRPRLPSLARTADASLALFADNLWPGARALADLLCRRPHLCAGRSVLELGAGAGLPSCVALGLGARRCVVSDFPEPSVLDNIGAVLTTNFGDRTAGGRAAVCGHAWGEDCASLLALNGGARFDLLLLSELLWKDTFPYHGALADSVAGALATDGQALLSVVHRPSGEHCERSDLRFLAALESRGLASEALGSAAHREAADGEDVTVLLYSISRT